MTAEEIKPILAVFDRFEAKIVAELDRLKADLFALNDRLASLIDRTLEKSGRHGR